MSSLNLDPKDTGKQYWKSLDELGEAPEFKTFLEREFPEGASEMGNGVSRRKFLQVMGAGMALAGVSGCKMVRRPEQNILPYNKMPESLIPGIPQFYATAMSVGGETVGLLVESHEGRPTKVEGNPKHPSSLGATGKYHQASVLGLYDPDRSQNPSKGGVSSDWASFWSDANGMFAAYKQNGAPLRFLSGYIASPSLAELKAHVLKTFPGSKWTTYEAVTRDAQAQGIAAVTGADLDPHYKFEAAKRVLSIDADFTESESDHLKLGRAFVSTRNPDLGTEKMSRLYLVESLYSPTGGTADHRLRVKPSQIVNVLILVAKELASQGLALGEWASEIGSLSADAATAGVNPEYIKELAKDILQFKGSSLVVVGKYQPALAHAIGHALNAALGNVGATVTYKPSAVKALNGETAGSYESIAELANAMGAGQVETLVILDANPAFGTPSDLDFAGKLGKVKHVINLGSEANETSALSEWHLPLSHFMEEWGDGLAYDGTASIAQPLIQPLYATQGATELLAGLSGWEHRKSHDIVKEYWRKQIGGMDFEHKWRESLHDGVIAKTAYASVNPGSIKDGITKLAAAHAAKAPKAGGLEIMFRAHPNLYDGRFANNAWLQELPDPITKLTWDNAVFVSPKLADKIGISSHLFNKERTGTTMGEYRHRPMVKVTVGGKSLEAVAWIVPGLSEDTILLHFGYGRRTTGKVGTGTGFDAYAIMNSASPFLSGDVKVESTGGLYEVACTQDHWSMEGRPIVREAGLESYVENKDGAFSEEKWNEHPVDATTGKERSLWTEGPDSKGGDRGTYDFSQGMQWGMVIDLNTCTGCNTCLLACTAENNIPVVGKEQVLRGREMHWIRLDRYFSGNVDNPDLVFQVMTCQQCENAPCEEVCPVAATVHSHEGLNDMAYNRCVGTRYCSNNCPYKVRRFNFFNYTNQWKNSTLSMQKNPDVTVRFRGVMEKCTYCTQRINRARIQYKNKGQETIPDGAVTPACAQACPTDAIVFGNINDASSRIAKLKAHPRNYGVLRDLNTKPRTTYLGKVRNPNKAIEKIAQA